MRGEEIRSLCNRYCLARLCGLLCVTVRRRWDNYPYIPSPPDESALCLYQGKAWHACTKEYPRLDRDSEPPDKGKRVRERCRLPYRASIPRLLPHQDRCSEHLSAKRKLPHLSSVTRWIRQRYIRYRHRKCCDFHHNFRNTVRRSNT